MAFPSTTASAREQPRFMAGEFKLPYYEDLYGKHNEDEEFDRFPDECQESSSDEETKNRPKTSEYILPSTVMLPGYDGLLCPFSSLLLSFVEKIAIQSFPVEPAFTC